MGRGASGVDVFVSVEGIEASGKTAVVRELAVRLRKDRWSVDLLRDFADPRCRVPVEDALRRSRFFSVGFDGGPRAAFLYMLYHEAAKWDRAASVSPDVMIADRFLDSVIAYQGHFLPPGVTDIVELAHRTSDMLRQIGIPIPVRTYLLDVSTSLSAERFACREDRPMTAFKIAHITQIRASLLALARVQPRFVVIDASRPLHEVVERVLGDLNTRIGDRCRT